MFTIKASRESVEISGEGPVKHLLMLYSQVTQSISRVVQRFGISEEQTKVLVLAAAEVAFHPDAVKLIKSESTEED